MSRHYSGRYDQRHALFVARRQFTSVEHCLGSAARARFTDGDLENMATTIADRRKAACRGCRVRNDCLRPIVDIDYCVANGLRFGLVNSLLKSTMRNFVLPDGFGTSMRQIHPLTTTHL